jgi:hypothetical protein
VSADDMPPRMRRFLKRPPARISPERVARRKRKGVHVYPQRMLDKLCQAQKNRCAYCDRAMTRDDSGRRATVDHVIPVSRGGRTRYDNVVAACSDCNGAKGSMLEHVFRAGVDVRAACSEARAMMWRKANGISAQGIEAGTAETVKHGSVHESPVGNADAPTTRGKDHHESD